MGVRHSFAAPPCFLSVFLALFGFADAAAVRGKSVVDIIGADKLGDGFRRALAGERVSSSVQGLGEVVLAPNVHVRKTVGVVGSVRKGG